MVPDEGLPMARTRTKEIRIQLAIFRVKGPEWVLAWYFPGSLPFRDPAVFAMRQPFN
jgi:hypothetical protein